jgi:hemolysin III
MYQGEKFNSISHLIGALFALAGGAVLVTVATLDGNLAKIVSYSVYATTLFILYLTSTLYHSIPGSAKNFLRVLDHQSIYLLIAGSYTPYAMVALDDELGWWVLGIIWSLALIGMVLDAVRRHGRRIVSVLLYLVMGWFVVFAMDDFVNALSAASMAWLIASGIFYTSGVVFFALDKWYPWCHGIWHLFVIAGSTCHYISILLL